MSGQQPIRLFVLSSSRQLGEAVSSRLQIPLSKMEERDFEDGEFKLRSLENVRGCRCFVLESLCGAPDRSVNDKLMRLLCFIGSLKDAAAASVTAIVPYTPFARKDRKTKHRDPLTLAYVARMIEAVGTDHYATMDIHNLQAYQNAFRIQTDHLKAENLFIDYILDRSRSGELTVMSPDIGGVKRATSLRDTLEKRVDDKIPLGFMEKKRSRGEVSGEAAVGEVEDRTVILVDDLVSSGTTLVKAARACKKSGAARVLAAVTHGIFSSAANERLADAALDEIVVTNTVEPFRLDRQLLNGKVTILDVAPVLAEAIRHMVDGTGLEEMWQEN